MAPLTTFLTFLSSSSSTSHINTRSTTAKPPAKNNNSAYSPGAGTLDPHHINNNGFFALFALIGVAFVLTAIWFFFWAKNGGFHFRQGDWNDYKSTVLRRKGPNGTTLSGATKTTRLGGGSVVHDEEKGWRRGLQGGIGGGGDEGRRGVRGAPRGSKNNDDNDVRAYRHEKPARVGGLNRESDGVFHQDFAASTSGGGGYSDLGGFEDATSQPSSVGGHVPINTPKAAKKAKGESGRWNKKAAQQPATPSPKKNARKDFYNQTPNSNASSDSHRPLRPNGQSPGGGNTPSRSRQSSPTKARQKSVPGSFYTEPLDFESRYSAPSSDAGLTEDSRGTKKYFHPIPGLSGGAGAGGNGGFRRGRGRRDSLSDSEGETVMS